MSFSGGGFSDVFARPAYQERAVPPYLLRQGEDRFAAYYSKRGRGVPDVAAQAENFRVVTAGREILVGGGLRDGQ